MNWHNLTVFQFQQLTRLWQEAKDETDSSVEMVAICYGLTEQMVDSMNTDEFRDKMRGLAFLTEVPEWKPQDYFEIEDRRYRFVYDVRGIHAARYIEAKQFSAGDFVAGMHKAAASMVVPQQKIKGKWVDAPYDAGKHSDYAADVQQAPITAIHGSAVFFCKLFATSIEALQGFLTQSLPMEKRKEAQELLQDSTRYLGGYTTLPSSVTMKESPLSKSTASPLSNS